MFVPGGGEVAADQIQATLVPVPSGGVSVFRSVTIRAKFVPNIVVESEGVVALPGLSGIGQGALVTLLLIVGGVMLSRRQGATRH